MPRTLMLAFVGLTAALAGCGGSGSSTGSSTTTAAAATNAADASSSGPFLAKLTNVSSIASTVPANGDVNPYGVAIVSKSEGALQAGNLLVSNFNDKANDQGTGTTIDQVTPAGKSSLFATISAKSLPGSCPGGVGLTTSLNVLPGGYVVVGSLPTTNGKSATAMYGCLIVLDSTGKPVGTIAGANIQGPWDSTAVSDGSKTTLFVSNALNGGAAKGIHTIDNSNVVRIVFESGAGQPPKVKSETIANGIPWRDSAEALVVGPTGLGLSANGTLYLADTVANSITAIPQALTRTTPAAAGGTTLTKGGHLNEPLGLTIAPNGNVITTNAGDGNIVETTPAGQQVAVQAADTRTGAGSLFGLVIAPEDKGIYFVDDGENTLNLLHAPAASSAATPGPETATTTSAAGSQTIGLAVRSLPKVGAVLVNSDGRTLYTFAPDKHSKVTCVSTCTSLWPPMKLASGQSASLSPQLNRALLSSDPDPEGGSVVTYAGWPLYTYAADSAAGQDNGQALETDGGRWYVISPSGKVVTTE